MAIREITNGLAFPEGPVAMDDGTLLVGEIPLGRVTRIKKDGSHQTIAECGGGTNGLAIGPDGAVYVCNNGGVAAPMFGMDTPYTGGRIERVDLATGKVERLYDSCDGARLHAPNDLMFDSHGGFYFSDMGHNGSNEKGEFRWYGGVYYAKADGSHINRVARLTLPNGVGISPDGKTLYYAESPAARIYGLAIHAPGVCEEAKGIVPRGNFVGGYISGGMGTFDSLGVQADGGICVGTLVAGGITTLGPGKFYEFFPIADEPMPTNLCWGGKDMKTAFVTLSTTGKVAAINWPRAGLRLNYNA